MNIQCQNNLWENFLPHFAAELGFKSFEDGSNADNCNVPPGYEREREDKVRVGIWIRTYHRDAKKCSLDPER